MSNLSNTQQNFLNFKHDSKSNQIFGFSANGTIVLTNNYKLFNLLHIIQFQKMHNTAISLIYDFRLPEILVLESQYKQFTNSIYFKQEDFVNSSNDEEEIDSIKIIILSDDEQKLKDFTRTIINYHKIFCINNFDTPNTSNCAETNSHAPRLQFFITVKNEHSNVKFHASKTNPEVYDTEPNYCNILRNHLNISSNVNLVNGSIDKLSIQAKTL